MIEVGKVYELRFSSPQRAKPMKLVRDVTANGTVYFVAVHKGEVSRAMDHAHTGWFTGRIVSGPHELEEILKR